MASCAEVVLPTSVLLSTTPQTVTGRNAPVMSCELGLRGLASACVPQNPGVRQTTGLVVLVVELVEVDVDVLVEVLVLVDVLVLVEVLVLVDVLVLVEVDVEVLVLVEVLVVVVMTSVPRILSALKPWSTVASCRIPNAVFVPPAGSPVRTRALASVTPAFTVIVHICEGSPTVRPSAGMSRLVARMMGFPRLGLPSAPGQKNVILTSSMLHAMNVAPSDSFEAWKL